MAVGLQLGRTDGTSRAVRAFRVASAGLSQAERGEGMGLAAVHDLRERRAPASAEELAAFETDVLAGFVLARASAGLADATIRSDLSQLEQIRAWFGRPLWELEPKHADAYFGQVLRTAATGTRLLRAQALTTYFRFLELRHRAEIYNLTG